MATTRRQPPLQIFQDPVASTDHHEVATYEPEFLDAFAPVTDVSDDHHTLLHPPEIFAHASSPKKTRHPSSSPPPRALQERGLNGVNLPRPQEQLFRTDAPVKKTQRQIHQRPASTSATGAPLFDNHMSQISKFDKENASSSFPQVAAHAVSAGAHKPGHKRGMSDAAPLRDRTNKKPKAREVRPVEEDGPLPEPEDMPPVEDDLSDRVKPPYSYANLIGMAILRAPNRRLTLAQIYKWISDTFAFYRNSQETGWQNSIRHNLSLSKSFSKQERPKDDPGKGHYWRINEGFEKQYYKVKFARRPTNPDGFVPSSASDMARPSSAHASFPNPLSTVKSIDSSKFPDTEDLSSDATIPCSDPAAAHDGIIKKRTPRAIPSSPPPADITSSPPPVARSIREDTPPRAPRAPSHSRSGGRKRKFAFGDSGYYSSIESSAIKGNPVGPLLTSEADLGYKRGRAEEEIARIRGSSYDSPTKTRPFMKQPSTALVSSPFRHMDKSRDGPLTPAFVFKRPALPPASASPNTNLRNHRNRMRELVGGSPDKSMPVLPDSFLNTSWSPAMSIPNDENVNLVGDGFLKNFDIFGDYDYQDSPLKPSAKRPRMERSATMSGALGDLPSFKTNMPLASPTPFLGSLGSPFLEWPAYSPARQQSQQSPMKAPTSNPLPEYPFPTISAGKTGLTPTQSFNASHFEAQKDDEIFHLLHSDESEPGIDLLQGFEKIGARAAVNLNGSPTKGARPGLHRSSTTRF